MSKVATVTLGFMGGFLPIVAGGVAITTAFFGTAWISSAWGWITTGFSWCVEKVKAGASWAWTKIKSGASWAWTKVKSCASWAWEKAKGIISWFTGLWS